MTDNSNDNADIAFSPHEAEDCLTRTWGGACSLSPKYAAKLRCIGGGPAFRRFGRKIIYMKNDLDAWVQERLGPAFANTTQADAAKREALNPERQNDAAGAAEVSNAAQ